MSENKTKSKSIISKTKRKSIASLQRLVLFSLTPLRTEICY